MKTGWDKSEYLSAAELGKYAWHRGFFKHNWNDNLWKRNFAELRLRDISIFSLGSIEGKRVLDVGCGGGILTHLFKNGC